MVRAYRLVYDDPHALPHLWEWVQPAIDHLVRNAHAFSQRVVQRYFSTWQALAGENTRIWDTHYRGRPIYHPWETWDAWLTAYRALVIEVQAMAEAHQWAGRNSR